MVKDTPLPQLKIESKVNNFDHINFVYLLDKRKEESVKRTSSLSEYFSFGPSSNAQSQQFTLGKNWILSRHDL